MNKTMECIYAALLLHSAKKPVDNAGVKKVLEAAGLKPDEARIKVLVASLEGVNIDEAIKQPVMTPAPAATAPPEQKKKEKEEAKEEKKSEEEAAGGLAALFG